MLEFDMIRIIVFYFSVCKHITMYVAFVYKYVYMHAIAMFYNYGYKLLQCFVWLSSYLASCTTQVNADRQTLISI